MQLHKQLQIERSYIAADAADSFDAIETTKTDISKLSVCFAVAYAAAMCNCVYFETVDAIARATAPIWKCRYNSTHNCVYFETTDTMLHAQLRPFANADTITRATAFILQLQVKLHM